MRASSSPTRLGAAIGAALLMALLAGDSAEAQKKKKLQNGEIVEFTGNVIGPDGEPVADVEIRLTASRKSFSISRFRPLLYHPREVTTRTDQYGSYRIEWPWHRFYNHFEIAAVVPIRKPGGAVEPEVLASANLDDRLRRGSPVVTPLELASTELLDALREFERSIDTRDERRVYEEQGKPDRVETTAYDDREEQAWWYFEQGAVYRFVAGSLREVESFEPVPGRGD